MEEQLLSPPEMCAGAGPMGGGGAGPGLTCLAGVRLARALRLAVSAMSMVCGSRPVCAYWAASGLWLYRAGGGERAGADMAPGPSWAPPMSGLGQGREPGEPPRGQWSATQG